MNQQFLEFEQPIAELEAKIEELRMVGSDAEVNLNDEIERLQTKCRDMTASIFSRLEPWQVAQLARHPLRPHTQDYVELLFDEFDELQGDRHYSNAPAIIGGVARFNNQPVMVIGNEKGRSTKDRVYRNFGSARPEAYRKALRLMETAEKFNMPIITFIDTSGAYPGIGAEERNQSEAIARNLFEMSTLRTPILCVVIGEGGSGGALAIGVGDRVLMLEHSVYSVISPEGCASILWKSAEKASVAAEAMQITAKQLLGHKLIDGIIPEPFGGAHRNYQEAADNIRAALTDNLARCQRETLDNLVQQRYQRLMSLGALPD